MSGTFAPRKHYNFDRNLAFCEDLALTATGTVQLSAADVIIQLGPGRKDAVWLINVTAIETNSNDEMYTFYLQGSDSSTFASGVHVLADINMGTAGGRNAVTGDPWSSQAATSVIGLYEVPFHNTKYAGLPMQGIVLDYLRVKVVIAGTIGAGGITFDSWVAIESE